MIDSFHDFRQRSRSLLAIPVEEAYYSRPISLRNPIVFYEGHLPVFAVNTLLKRVLERPGIDPALEILFERGIDPEGEAAVKSPSDGWPRRDLVQAYATEADARVSAALAEAPRDAALTVLEHELMHQETLLYMFHNMPYPQKRRPHAGPRPSALGPRLPPEERIAIPAGTATLGAADGVFGWDNELPEHRIEVGAFEIDRCNVTNGQFLEYVEATGAPAPHFWREQGEQWYWRGMFELILLPLDWPVYVTHDQAAAYAAWKGMRLPTEAEYHRAAFGTPSGEERLHPWGDEPPDASRGNFDFANWDPVPAGSYPRGASAWGVHDLVGNGWEWTSSRFAPFEGFKPMWTYPQYSVDFFDEHHFVLKGASPATARELIRRSFRNWFRPNYPYVYATFRCVR